MHLTIIIPCYNEAERLSLTSFTTFMTAYPDIHFIFVSDGSTDKTAEFLLEFQALHPQTVQALILKQNRGKAEAVRLGVLQAFNQGAQQIGFWDADLATPLNVIPLFQQKLDDNPHLKMVTGCRVRRLGSSIRRKLTRHLMGRTFASAVAVYLRLPVYDTQCGAKLFSAELVAKHIFDIPFSAPWFFDVEIFKRMTLLYGKETVQEIVYEHPLKTWMDVNGSKVKIIKALYHFIKLLLSVQPDMQKLNADIAVPENK